MHWFLAKQKFLRSLATHRAEVVRGDEYDAFVPTYPDALADALPFFPGDGETECGESCRCARRMTTRWSDAEGTWATYATWQTAGDASVCAECAERARQWQEVLIGIELNRDKVRQYSELYSELGGYQYDRDPGRPGWYALTPNERWADHRANLPQPS